MMTRTMTLRRVFTLAVLAALVWSAHAGGRVLSAALQTNARARLAATIKPVIDAVWTGYDMKAAMGHVEFIGSRWRLPGNPSYNASIDRIRDRLTAAGLTPTVEEYPNNGPAWDHTVGTLALVTEGKPDEPVITDHIALCINSFGTSPEGVVARLVDVGRGADTDFAGKDVKGAVVLGDAAPGQLWTRAVVNGGAIGIVSVTAPARYLNPDPPGAPATPADQWNIFQWTSVPYDADRKAFGFKGTAKTAGILRQRLASAQRPVSVRVTIDSSFSTGPVRTLSIEIPGRTAAAERIVLAAHVQEPGANDNASGVATLAETVVALAHAIKAKKVPQPERTLTFLFLTEISGSRQWLRDHAEAAKQVKYMFSLDMTGEDVKKTGGSFLIERYPDPGAAFHRPWDPDTEWGPGNVRPDSLKGDLINDEHLFVVQEVARKSNWVVHTNPYEGGSDHSEFQRAGIPSVLNWHFTDRYYHSNLDTPDKTSPEEMRNVGVSVAASAWLLASATPAIATDVAGVVAAMGHDRVALETTEGAKLAAKEADQTAAQAREKTIVAAWNKWYAEAVRSASRLVLGTPPASFTSAVNALAAGFEPRSAMTEGSGTTRALVPGAAWLMAAPQANRGAITDYTTVFVCGEDQKIPPRLGTFDATLGYPTVLGLVDQNGQPQLDWTMIVLAGDGRLYRPCPKQNHLSDHREVRELTRLAEAIRSRDEELRWRAAQAWARNSHLPQVLTFVTASNSRDQTMVGMPVDGLGQLMGTQNATVIPACNAVVQTTADRRRWQPGYLFSMLQDESPRIRYEAAYGLGVRVAEPDVDPVLLMTAVTELQVCVNATKANLTAQQVAGQKSLAWLSGDDVTAALLIEAVGAAHYTGEEQRRDVELFLQGELETNNLRRRLGAVKAIEAFIRKGGERPTNPAIIARLRGLFGTTGTVTDPQPFDLDARTRRLAMLALQEAQDSDATTLTRAALDTDWQVRRLVAGSLNLSDPFQTRAAEILADDPAFQVRYDMLSAIGRLVIRTHECAPLVARFKDLSPLVVMRAMDLVNPACTDLDTAVAKLNEFAERIPKSDNAAWQMPARALTALARVKPEEARQWLPSAAKHADWQMRAAAATASGLIGDEEIAIKLAHDEAPNVRNAALDALFHMKSAHVVEEASAALESDDFQLIRTAAGVMKGMHDSEKEKASDALLAALHRLTDGQHDPSRDPRVAMLERLAEVLPPVRNQELLPYVGDYDDKVAEAAEKAFEKLVGAPSAGVEKRRRYPFQAQLTELQALPTEAVIELEIGTVRIALLSDVAPVTVARFAKLVAEGYYNGLTFHRVVPNFVVQGGSPGANEYMGASRYMRDELGPQGVHVRSAVGISTRGGDTGDGQIFIDLADAPRLDRDYTVFGYVKPPTMELVDAILEGARIKSISVR